MQNIITIIHFTCLCFIIRIYWHSFWGIIIQRSHCVYNFITWNYWIFDKTFHISIINLTSAYTRIPNMIFFAYKILFRTFTLTLEFIATLLLIRIPFSKIKFPLIITWSRICDSFLIVIMLKIFKITSFASFGTLILLDTTWRVILLSNIYLN